MQIKDTPLAFWVQELLWELPSEISSTRVLSAFEYLGIIEGLNYQPGSSRITSYKTLLDANAAYSLIAGKSGKKVRNFGKHTRLPVLETLLKLGVEPKGFCKCCGRAFGE